MKQKNTLREFSKFVSGLVFADLLSIIWFLASDRLPIDFWGVMFTAQHAGVAIVFDIVLFFFFVYYGWHRHHQSKNNQEYLFHYALGVILTLVAIVHLSRVIFGFAFVIGTWQVPLWLNAAGAIATGILAYLSFVLAKK